MRPTWLARQPGNSRPLSSPHGDLSAEALGVLQAIDGLSPYELPNLKLKTDAKYAHIDKDLAPFHHVKPFKEHFLTQIEYTGPGRAVPEPDDVKSVKIGFIGPIQPTVSVATGGRSHEEVLGTKMLQGAQLAIDEANAKGGYLRRKLPFELVISNDNGLWGSSGNEIIKMAYKDNAWAILGTVDGANQPHQHSRRAEGRDPGDEYGRHRPDLRRNQYPLDLPRDRRRPADGLSADELPV